MFGGNFAPLGWMFCEGQLLPISENETLFNLIGTTYGGDGVNTFALPNLCGRAAVHQGQGTGLSPYVLGQVAGSESVTLTSGQVGSHAHALMASQQVGSAATPGRFHASCAVTRRPGAAGWSTGPWWRSGRRSRPRSARRPRSW